MASGADIPALVRRLRSPRRLEQVQAAEALARLAGDCASDLLAAGGHIALARLLVNASSQAARSAAARALNSLNIVGGVNEALMQLLYGKVPAAAADSIPELIAQLRNSDGQVQQAAAFLLGKVASLRSKKAAVVAAGGVDALLDGARHPTGSKVLPSQLYCVAGLSYLCQGSLEVQRAVAAAGGAALLVGLLETGDSMAQEAAALCLERLAKDCPEAQQAAEAAGAMPTVAQLLSSSASEAVRSAAVRALWELRLQWQATPARLLASSIPALVRIVQSSSSDVDRHAAIGLMAHTFEHASQQERLAFVAAGAVPALRGYVSAYSQDTLVDSVVQLAVEMLDTMSCLSPSIENAEAWDAPVGELPCVTAALPQPAPSTTAAPHPTPARLPRICAAPGCGATSGLKRCGGCGFVRYCSVECSRAHWQAHKAECRRLQAERAAGDIVQP